MPRTHLAVTKFPHPAVGAHRANGRAWEPRLVGRVRCSPDAICGSVVRSVAGSSRWSSSGRRGRLSWRHRGFPRGCPLCRFGNRPLALRGQGLPQTDPERSDQRSPAGTRRLNGRKPSGECRNPAAEGVVGSEGPGRERPTRLLSAPAGDAKSRVVSACRRRRSRERPISSRSLSER